MALDERERIACAIAEKRAAEAQVLLKEATAELDAVGLFGIAGVGRDALRQVAKLLKRTVSAAAPEADHG